MRLMTDHFQKTFFPGAGNRNHRIVSHHYVTSFAADILFHLVKVDDVRFMDTKEGMLFQTLFKIPEWF